MEYEPSVIERLMGFDSLPTKEPVRRHVQLFSDNYLRQMSSFQYRPKLCVDRSKDVAARLRITKGNVLLELSSSELKRFSSVESKPASYQDHVDQKRHSKTLATHSIGQSLKAVQATSQRWNTSSRAKYDQHGIVKPKICTSNSMKMDTLSITKSKYKGQMYQIDAGGPKRRSDLSEKKSTAVTSITASEQYLNPQSRYHFAKKKLGPEKISGDPNILVQTEMPSYTSVANTVKFMMGAEVKYETMLTKIQKLPPSDGTLLAAHQNNSHVLDGIFSQDYLDTLSEVALNTMHSPEPLSPTNLEESCQRSPVSVLNTSSNAGHYKDVNAEIQELRVQLELLDTKFPEECSQSSIRTSSDTKDNWEKAVDLEAIKFCYLADVLDQSGFSCGAWGPEYYTLQWEKSTVNLSIFETLEKIYGQHTYWARADRRLFFDLINTCLWKTVELHHSTKLKPALLMSRLSPSLFKPAQDEIAELLVILEKEANDEKPSPITTPIKDLRWSDFTEDIDDIGLELETLLVGELIDELVSR